MTPRITARTLLGAALAIGVACSTDRSGLDSDGGADAGQDAGGDTRGTGGGTGTGGVSGTGGRAGSGGAGGGSGICGGIAGLTCPANTFCQHTAGQCDAPDASGTCLARPVVCAEIYAPVCGCDNHTYDNDCMRQGAGVSKRADDACNPAGCPDAAPAPGATCPMAALSCRYQFPDDPFCWRIFKCQQGLTWAEPQAVCARASSGGE